MKTTTQYVVCLNIRKLQLTDDQMENMDYTENGEFILAMCHTAKQANEKLTTAVESFDVNETEEFLFNR
jgi:hypothetical protein